jgi:uncharacterized protein (DUF433 family)
MLERVGMEPPAMAQTASGYKYIQLDEQRVPYITGTTMKVVELVEAQQAYGWSPEEIHIQHRYLTMGQIHSALPYYWDHQQELDADLERRFQYAEKQRQETGETSLARKLRAQRAIQ